MNSSKRKKSYYKQCGKRHKLTTQLEAGLRGFLVTFSNANENFARKEILTLLDEYSDEQLKEKNCFLFKYSSPLLVNNFVLSSSRVGNHLKILNKLRVNA